MLKREIYLSKIRPFIDKKMIKVLTGIRRCGKSTILNMIKDELITNGIQEANIIYINFESMKFSDIVDAKKLYEYVENKRVNQNKYYIMLDEIQQVKDFEKAVNSFMVDFDCDIFMTGSNSSFLSSELATVIAGRYVEININTLNFREYIDFKKHFFNIKEFDYSKELLKYLKLGGFPILHVAEYELESAYRIVNDIYSSAVLRDIVERNNIRNIPLLQKIMKFVFENIGNIFSAKKVSDFIKSQNRKVDIETIYNYLNLLENAFIIQRISRYDIKGKEVLQTNEKYFVSDIGLRNAVMGYKDSYISGALENIVFLELLSRGYNVFVGKIDNKEIDFIAEKQNKKVYIQVAYKLSEEKTIEREFKPLKEVRDNYPKYVVTMEENFYTDNIEGINHINLVDFLLDETI